MLTPADFIYLTYSNDLNRACVDYACQSLIYTLENGGRRWYEQSHKIAADASAELAFRHYLTTNRIPHDLIRTTPFTKPEHLDVALGGRRCMLINSLISRRETIRRLRKDSKSLLKISAMVPEDKTLLDQLADTDIFLFAFTFALIAVSLEEINKARKAHQPILLIHKLPDTWRHPGTWEPFGELTLEAEHNKTVSIHIGGIGSQRKQLNEKIILPVGQVAKTKENYDSLIYLSTDQFVDGKLHIHSQGLNHSHVVEQRDWRNIWIYGIDIALTGYITCGSFRRQSSPVPAGSKNTPLQRLDEDHLALPLAKLYPLAELFSRTKKWAEK